MSLFIFVNFSYSQICEATNGNDCYYVATDGNDANPGTYSQPFRRAQPAVRLATAGDYIYIRGGTYNSTHGYAVEDYSFANCTDPPIRRFMHVGRVRVSSCNSETGVAMDYNVNSGTASFPITVKAYPGETVLLDSTSSFGITERSNAVHFGSLSGEVAYWNLFNIRIRRNNINIGGGSNSGATPINQVHDITVRGCEVYAHRDTLGANVGMIRVDRGDWGGPYNITIDSNSFHDLESNYFGTIQTYPNIVDVEHFAAINTLSCESYTDTNCIGNGRLTFTRNTIYNVGSHIFVKNPTLGPMIFKNNTFYNGQSMGRIAGSNTTFDSNLVRSTPVGLGIGGYGGNQANYLYTISGKNFSAKRNTFVNVNTVFSFLEHGNGHTLKYNVLFGLSQTSVSFDNRGYFSRFVSDCCSSRNDPGPGLSISELHRNFATTPTFADSNCLIATSNTFLAASRHTGEPVVRTGLTLTQVRDSLGQEIYSTFIRRSNTSNGLDSIFVDPTNNDYRLETNSGCPDYGLYTPTISSGSGDNFLQRFLRVILRRRR